MGKMIAHKYYHEMELLALDLRIGLIWEKTKTLKLCYSIEAYRSLVAHVSKTCSVEQLLDGCRNPEVQWEVFRLLGIYS